MYINLRFLNLIKEQIITGTKSHTNNNWDQTCYVNLTFSQLPYKKIRCDKRSDVNIGRENNGAL